MSDAPRRAIAWFRRDLRLADNRTLEAATAAAERVWPVFVADPAELERHAAAPGRVAWFAATLGALDRSLRAAGSGLIVLEGPPERALRAFAREVEADLVLAGADDDPVAVARDARVADALALRLVDDQRVVAPADLRTGSGIPFTRFAPFRRALEGRLAEDPRQLASARADLTRLAPPPGAAPGTRAFPAPVTVPELPDPGEAAAARRLREFLRADLAGYGGGRDRPDLDLTSRLSPHLRVGSISVRACWRAAFGAAERGRDRSGAVLAPSAASWRRELAWREFFAHVMAGHPRVATEGLRPEHEPVAWEGGAAADEMLAAWHDGRTGYPFVDAGMRQLVRTGWMHNRARLVTASFLVKDLGIDWRRGEAVFARHLLDADAQQNGGNWQWVAGVGADAAPYFRIFNPTLQARRFDPDGSYIRRWVPELSGLSTDHLHEPWRAPRPPRGYPGPIVDHAEARDRALARRRADARRGRPHGR